MHWGQDFFQTYPFHIHDANLGQHPGYQLTTLHDNGAQIHDMRCLRVTYDGKPCEKCGGVNPRVEHIRIQCRQSSMGEGIPIHSLNQQQLVNRYKRSRRTLAKEELKVCISPLK